MCKPAAFLIALLFSLSANAVSQITKELDEQILALSESRQWLKLLHVEKGETEIGSATFFLTNPVADNFTYQELVATLQKVKINSILDNGFSFKCNYPARTLFLAKHGFIDAFSLSDCPELIEWIGADEFDISIVYADGYLGNPASFYGHLILKFETDEVTKDLFSNSVNFGAVVPNDENPIVYILKGLFGGYQAEYSSNYFFRHNVNYTEVEMRDLWKYTLQLNKYDKNLLAAHAWELMRSEYTYYFTSRNCAYHLAKAIEVVTQEDILSSLHPFVLPIDVFKSMEKMQQNGMPLVTQPDYIPSRQSKFRHNFSGLSPTQQKAMKTYFSTNETIKAMQLGLDSQLLDVFYDYVSFALTQAKGDEQSIVWLNTKKRDIQLARIKLPANETLVSIDKPKVDPDVGHKPSLARFVFAHSDSNNVIDLTLRPAFYDLLSSGGSLLPNSALTMGEVGIRLSANNVELSHIDLLKIETYPVKASGLNYDEGLAWNVNLGGQRNYIDGLDNRFEVFAQGGAGYASRYFTNTTLYATLNAKVTSPNLFGSRVFLLPTIGLLGSIQGQKLHCELSYVYDIKNHSQRSKRKIGCGISLLQSESADIRIRISAYFKTEASIGFSWYW